MQEVRRVIADLKIRHVVSPRASVNGGKLIAGGMSAAQAADAVLWKGLDVTTRTKIQQCLRLSLPTK